MKGIENLSQSEKVANPERLATMKQEVMDALLFNACADAEGFQDCARNWFDENEELFESGFDRLIQLRPNALEEWESADPQKRAEIMDIINGPIVGRSAEMDVAA